MNAQQEAAANLETICDVVQNRAVLDLYEDVSWEDTFQNHVYRVVDQGLVDDPTGGLPLELKKIRVEVDYQVNNAEGQRETKTLSAVVMVSP